MAHVYTMESCITCTCYRVIFCLFLLNEVCSAQDRSTAEKTAVLVVGCILAVLLVSSIVVLILCCKSKNPSVSPSEECCTAPISNTGNVDRPVLGPPTYSSLFPSARLPPIQQSVRDSSDSVHTLITRQTVIPTISPPPSYVLNSVVTPPLTGSISDQNIRHAHSVLINRTSTLQPTSPPPEYVQNQPSNNVQN